MGCFLQWLMFLSITHWRKQPTKLWPSFRVCLCYVSMERHLRQPWCRSSAGWSQAKLHAVCCIRDHICWILDCKLYVLKRPWVGRMDFWLFALPMLCEPCWSKDRCGQRQRERAGWQPAAHDETGEEQGPLHSQNHDGRKQEAFWGPRGDTSHRPRNYHKPLALKSWLERRLCPLKDGVS